MKICCEKDDYHGKWACVMDIEGEYYHEDISSEQVDLAYDSFTLKIDIVDYRDI